MLEAMVAEVGADELMIQDLIATPSDRLASYRLIAEAFELDGNALPRTPAGARSVSGGDTHAA